jgi:glycosyltransferase involved in cell wall biosynthesis
MSGRIFYDGLNLSLTRGTGVATYARSLTRIASDIGYEVGVVYEAVQRPPKDKRLREIAFFDEPRATRTSPSRRSIHLATDTFRHFRPVAPARVVLDGTVIIRQFENALPAQDHVFATRYLFAAAERHFAWTNKFTRLTFEARPDVFHCTYPLPLRVPSARNIYTIHDLVPFRLPFTTLDNKRQMFRILKKIAMTADKIVTVSENSKADIISLFGVEDSRIVNTYQAVHFPKGVAERSDSAVSQDIESSFGLRPGEYLLFFGALEPKKNVTRLVEAYLSSGVDIPLVLVAAGGWLNDAENSLISAVGARQRTQAKRTGRCVERVDYVSVSMLVSLIRGATAVLFPSLYEGFGLPVLEAMMLGTPVVTSRAASLPEVAGDAALLIDPYDTDDIREAIRTIANDSGLRDELSRAGRLQAAKFSVERYRERLAALYRGLI